MDYLIICSDTLEGLNKELEMFLTQFKKKNFKLKTSKFCIGEEVEIREAMISIQANEWVNKRLFVNFPRTNVYRHSKP